jgi:hypothetical protein
MGRCESDCTVAASGLCRHLRLTACKEVTKGLKRKPSRVFEAGWPADLK